MAALLTIPGLIPISQPTTTTTNPTRLLLYYTTTTTKTPTICPTKSSTPFTAVFCSAARHSRRPEYIPNRIPDPQYVRVFDTTLRDGEQSPGASMTSKEKLDVARQLAKLGVDIIEAGFPAASNDDLEAVKMIAKEVGNEVDENGYVPVICGLARCYKKDIDASWEAVKHAKRPRIHTFIATSEIHMKHKLKKTKEEVIETARSMVSYARSLGCDDVEFSPEDAGRSDREFLYQILGEVIKAGATTLNIPDTVGYTMPDEFGRLIADIRANTSGIENVIISTHCQNDLGLSTANTLAGACGGARQVEVTINGIGERAGNASLEEVVMALKCRGDQMLGGLYTGINTKQIIMSSKMVEEYTGLHVQPHKAIVGANAFAHESGIHQDGMLKSKDTYEIISPDDIGLHRSNESGIVLGKLSGRHALRSRLSELGFDIDSKDLDDLFWRFKAVAEKKKAIQTLYVIGGKWCKTGLGGGGDGDGGGGREGGGGGGGEGEGEERFDRNRVVPMLGSPKMARELESQLKQLGGSDLIEKIVGLLVSRRLNLRKGVVNQWRADDCVLLAHLLIGSGLFCLFDKVMARDAVMRLSCYLPAPTNAGILNACPDNTFQVALAGTSAK